jgi:probable phosphoglycerate mutase
MWGTIMAMVRRGAIHHVELWVRDLEAAEASFGWLLVALGYQLSNSWPVGRSWRLGDAYIVVESGPDVLPGVHQRLRPGLNHFAFHAGTERQVEELAGEAVQRGWTLLFADRHPHAGGPAHYAAYLENEDGFEIELVASQT